MEGGQFVLGGCPFHSLSRYLRYLLLNTRHIHLKTITLFLVTGRGYAEVVQCSWQRRTKQKEESLLYIFVNILKLYYSTSCLLYTSDAADE